MTESSIESPVEVIVDSTEEVSVRVLHVDDEVGFLKVAKQCLEMHGALQIETASSVDEAMEKMKKKTYDVVVSDYQMPEKDGIDFLKELREKDKTVSFIMFTGRGREEVAIRALNLGADRYLNKTGDPETVYGELAHSIRQTVKQKRAEKMLKESEEKYRNLFENAKDVTLTLDLKGRMTSINKAAEEYGFKKDEIIGKNMRKYAPKKYWPRLFKELAHLTRGKAAKGVIEIITPKGKKTAEYNSSPIIINNRVVGVQSILKDVTERKKVEREIRESQQKFKLFFMNNPEAADYLDPTFHIIDINPRFEELFGYSLDEIKGKHINDLIVPEDRMEEAEMLDKKAGERIVYHDTLRKRKDGTFIPVSISAAPITLEGKLVGTVGLYKDISQLKKTENELEESRRHFQMLFNVMVDPVVIVDRRGKFLEVTDRVEEITGFKREELLGKNFLRTKIVTPRSKAVLIKNLAKRMVGMHVPPYEVDVLTKDGKKIQYEINAARIEYKGKQADLVAFRDVSERKKTMEKLKILNEKLGVIGKLTRHDVRNKLSTITGNVYLTRQKLTRDHETLEHLSEIESACGQMERILDFARVYEKIGMEELAYMDVENSLGEAIKLSSDLQGIKIVNDCKGLKVLADSLLHQLFYNLIHNSMRHGEKVVQIRLHYEKTEKDRLKLIFEDNGVGIPDDEKEKIFKEGYGKGTGYGLYLIRKMCDVYGWTIQETGKQGKGAQFTTTIPKKDEKGRMNYQFQCMHGQVDK